MNQWLRIGLIGVNAALVIVIIALLLRGADINYGIRLLPPDFYALFDRFLL